jgi:hypothetical protein
MQLWDQLGWNSMAPFNCARTAMDMPEFNHPRFLGAIGILLLALVLFLCNFCMRVSFFAAMFSVGAQKILPPERQGFKCSCRVFPT